MGTPRREDNMAAMHQRTDPNRQGTAATLRSSSAYSTSLS